jgi:hypothetical protein
MQAICGEVMDWLGGEEVARSIIYTPWAHGVDSMDGFGGAQVVAGVRGVQRTTRGGGSGDPDFFFLGGGGGEVTCTAGIALVWLGFPPDYKVYICAVPNRPAQSTQFLARPISGMA